MHCVCVVHVTANILQMFVDFLDIYCVAGRVFLSVLLRDLLVAMETKAGFPLSNKDLSFSLSGMGWGRCGFI